MRGARHGYSGTEDQACTRYVFFLRHFNDIDNISPIIHCFLNASPSHKAEVFLYDENYCGLNDMNLAMLGSEFPDQFRWSWLGEHFGLCFQTSRRVGRLKRVLRKIPRVMSRLWHHSKKLGKSEILQRGEAAKAWTSSREGRWRWLPVPLLSLADIRSGQAGAKRISATLGPLIVGENSANLVIFDLVRSHYVRGLLKALRAIGCRSIVCLPVSPLVNYNVLREYDFVTPESLEFQNRHDYSGFDALSYVDGLYLAHYRQFIKSLSVANRMPTTIGCIGSLRYYPEWIQIREKSIISQNTIQPMKNVEHRRRRLLVLLSRLKSNVNAREVQTCLKSLAELSHFEVRVKGHPRSGDGDKRIDLYKLGDCNDKDTSELIEWSDAVIFWGTSAALEGYAKGKIMICIPYVCSNLNLYAYYQAGFIANCRDELVLFLHHYALSGCPKRYNRNGIDVMMREVVRAREQDWNAHRKAILNFLEGFEYRHRQVFPTTTA